METKVYHKLAFVTDDRFSQDIEFGDVKYFVLFPEHYAVLFSPTAASRRKREKS